MIRIHLSRLLRQGEKTMTDGTRKTIIEVLLGMAVYLTIASVFVLIFTKDKFKGEGGLLLGGLAASGMLFSMKHTIYKGMHMQKGQSFFFAFASVSRMLLAAALILAVGYFGWLNIFTTFVGFFSLKFGAYIQPLTDKLITKAIKNKQGG